MTDEQIFQLHNQEQKRNAMVYRQVQFLKARVEAYERVFNSTWNVLRGIFQPSLMAQLVDEEQMKIVRKHDELLKETEEKAKQNRQKQRLTIVSPNAVVGSWPK